MSDWKTMQPQPSELELAALRHSVADLRKKVEALTMENDDLYRELDSIRAHRLAVRLALMELSRVVSSWKSPVTDSDAEIPGGEAK